MSRPDWIPIDPANPPRGLVQLWRPSAYADTHSGYDVGGWQDDRHAKRPRPYWQSDLYYYMGAMWARRNPPSHYAPLPEGPA